MEGSHHSARVREREELFSILAHIQGLASPREVLTVLLRRAVVSYGFSSGWVFPGDGKDPLDGYPPLEAQKAPSLEELFSPLEALSEGKLVEREGSFFVLVPLDTPAGLQGVLLLKRESRPEPWVLEDLEVLARVAAGWMARCQREIRRVRDLGCLMRAQKKGRALFLLDDRREIKARAEEDLRDLTGCEGVLLFPVEQEGRGFRLPPWGKGLDGMVARALDSARPVVKGHLGVFPLVHGGEVLGVLVVKGDLGGKRGVVEVYLSSLVLALRRALEISTLKERFRGVVTSPLLGIFQLDSEGRLVFLNATLAMTLGYPMMEMRDLLGRSFEELIHPSSRDVVVERLRAQLDGEERPRIQQVTMVDKDGSSVPMMVSTVPISLPQAERGILGVAIDITEKERLLEDLSQRNKELESFAYSAAHELKGPIVYLKRVVAQPSLDNFPMEELKWAVNRLESTLKHLTAYSLMDNKEVVLERLSPYLLVEGIWRDLAKEVGITMDIAINLPPVIKSDPFLLELIFKNLLRNAFKYGIKGTPPIVEVGYARKKGEFLFYVRDHGEGFPPEKAQEIFKPFVRLHAGKKGTGLGLTIAKKAVEKLGGRIWAEGKPGEGATFYFTHPIL